MFKRLSRLFRRSRAGLEAEARAGLERRLLLEAVERGRTTLAMMELQESTEGLARDLIRKIVARAANQGNGGKR